MGLDGRAEEIGRKINRQLRRGANSPQADKLVEMGTGVARSSRDRLKVLGKRAVNWAAPLPSEDFTNYMRHITAGLDPQIPFNPENMQALVEEYGKDGKNIETGRFRVLSPDGSRELSFHITKKDGAYRVLYEGEYPHDRE